MEKQSLMNNRQACESVRRRCSVLVAAVLLAATALAPAARAQELPRANPEAVGLSSERLRRLTDALNGYVKDGKLSGGVALIARRGKVAYVEAFGQRDREARAPMREDAIFRIASQTKALVSVAVMILQEDGRLLLNDPVGKYLPEFRETTVAVPKQGGGYDVVKAKRQVTVRDLLTHTAGVGYGGGPARDRWEAARITGWYFAEETSRSARPSRAWPRSPSSRSPASAGCTATRPTSSARSSSASAAGRSKSS